MLLTASILAADTARSQSDVVDMLADPARPRLYAIKGNGKETGSVSIIDTFSRSVIKEITVGKEPTDLALTENSGELLVMNTTDQTITRIDLESLTISKTVTLAAFDSTNNDSGGHVADGPGGMIYYVDEAFGPRLRVYDTKKGAVVQTFGATTSGTADDHGVGDLVVSPDQTALYAWAQYGDGLGWDGTYFVRFDIAPDGTLKPGVRGSTSEPPLMRRGLLNSKALMSSDGARLFIKNRMVDAGNPDSFPAIYANDVRSVSPDGKIVATSSAILSADDGSTLFSLPVAATAQVFLPDMTALAYYNSGTQTIGWLDLPASVGAGVLGQAVTPADGSIVTSPARLEWFPLTGVQRYQVFLGTVRGEVEAATPTSPLYLGESAGTAMAIPTPPVAGTDCFWKVVPLGADGLPVSSGTIRSFRVSKVAPSRSSIKFETVLGVTHHLETLRMEAPTTESWTAKSDVTWLKFQNAGGSTPGDLVATISTSSLRVGTYSGKITITTSGDTFVITVSMRIYAAAPTYTVSAPGQQAVFLVSESSSPSGQPAFLLRINTQTNQIESDAPCGKSVRGMAFHAPENRIYLTNWETGIVRAFDPADLRQLRTYQTEPQVSGNTHPLSGGAFDVAAGRAGRLVLTGSVSSLPATVRLIDTGTGQVIDTAEAASGNGKTEQSGRYFYHNGQGQLTRFDLASDRFVKGPVVAVANTGNRVQVSPGGTRVVVGTSAFDSELNLKYTLSSAGFAVSHQGELVFSTTKVLNGGNGFSLATLPVSTSVKSVSGDQTKLYQFTSNSLAYQVFDLTKIGAISPGALVPGIPDGSVVVANEPRFSWSSKNEAVSYNIYLGTTRSAVEAATPSSGEFLGNTTDTLWTGALPPLEFGQTYWWRVDAVGFNSTLTGAAWSFKTPVIDIDPLETVIETWAGGVVPNQKIDLISKATVPAAGAPVAWIASTITPWIFVKTSAGSTPATLDFEIRTEGLPAGTHAGSITIEANGDAFTVPVRLTLKALDVVKIIPHPGRQVVYGINRPPGDDPESTLLEIDAASGAVLRTLPAGRNATDADIDPLGEKIYISNLRHAETRIVDLNAWAELPPLLIGTDVYLLDVGRSGRIITENPEQWTNISLKDSSTGALIDYEFSIRQGGGLTDPTGRYYYHADTNSSGAKVTKYDVGTDQITELATSPVIAYGSDNLVRSRDGTRLFWQGRVMDPDLRILGRVPAEVHATTGSGEIAVGQNELWWSDSGTRITTLPFSSTVDAISAEDKHLVRFDPAARMIRSIALKDLVTLPGPSPRPDQLLAGSPERLVWSPVPGALSYRIFMAENEAALSDPASLLASATTNSHELTSPLPGGRRFSWRVDAVTAEGVVPGAVQSFGIRYEEGPKVDSPMTGVDGRSVSLSGTHLLAGCYSIARIYEFDPITGGTRAVGDFQNSSTNPDSSFGTAVAMGGTRALVGAPALGTFSSGLVYDYQDNGFNQWQVGAPSALPSATYNEYFGTGLATSGNLMLAGTGLSNSKGRVAAYTSHPSMVRTQVFSANDGVSGDCFGQAIAIDGNEAVVASYGSGSTTTRLPAVYLFARDPSTGLWAQTRKIPLPGATVDRNPAPALALSGNLLAFSNTTKSSVEIYEKDASGTWLPSATIRQADVAGSLASTFAKGLAFYGDQLFIGDPGGSYLGAAQGVVFSFRRISGVWTRYPDIIPNNSDYSNFGRALSASGGWLAVSGGSSQQAWLFRIPVSGNHPPRFTGETPTQLVAGRPFSAEITAEDADGTEGLVFSLLQGPSWLRLDPAPGGRATLSTTNPPAPGTVVTVQIQVRDPAGAQAHLAFILTSLSAGDLPIFTRQPQSMDVKESSQAYLNAAATGVGPFTWQWYRNGEPVKGANQATLALPEITLDDAGSYSVAVSNVVGKIESLPAVVAVHPKDPAGDDWPTFGGGPQHTGYQPAKLGRHYLVEAWSRRITLDSASLNRAVTGGGMIFLTQRQYFSPSEATAYDFLTGNPVWKSTFKAASTMNPPTYHNGRVYFQRGNHSSDSQLWALDATTGATIWSSATQEQWDRHEAPAVTDAGIWVNGGSYGGMYGFSHTGTRNFFVELDQADEWTPTLANGRLFSWVSGNFREHDPATGNVIWWIDTGNNVNAYHSNSVSAISGNRAVMIGDVSPFHPGLTCIDIQTRSILWKREGEFQGSPAIANGRVFALEGDKLVEFSLADGTPGPETVFPETLNSGQPLVVDDYLFVASDDHAYVVEKSTRSLVRTLTGGGLLGFAKGRLYASGTDGMLRVWEASTKLRFTGTPERISANDRGEDSMADLAPLVFDPDGGTGLKWKIVSNSNPSIFSEIALDGNGILHASYNPYSNGFSDIVIQVENPSGETAETSLEVYLPMHSEPSLKVSPRIRLNRSNGLYEQKVTVTNTAQRAIAGFDLLVSGLSQGVVFHNATRKIKGGGVYSYRKSIAAGESITVTLRYYAARRGVIAAPMIGISLQIPEITAKSSIATAAPKSTGRSNTAAFMAVASQSSPAAPFAIRNIARSADGTIIIRFPTETGANYRMQYSRDCIGWKDSPEIIPGIGAEVEWTDSGPPATETPPGSDTRRFYRLQRVAP